MKNREWPNLIIVWVFLVFTLSMAATLIPMENELFGFDWKVYFSEPQNVPGHYPPWTTIILRPLSYHLLAGITLATFIIVVYHKQVSLLSAFFAFISLPLFWVLFLGQLDGLALLGILGLPFLPFLVLLKPQIAAFALFARREYIISGLALAAISYLIWGLWPLDMIDYYQAHTNSLDPWVQDVGLGWRGLPIFLFILWKMPRHDTDWWMLAGAFITPTLIPYHLLPLMPAISRLKPLFAAAVAISTWLPLTSNWLGPSAWNLTWVSLLLLGFGLAYEERKTGDLVPRLSGNIR